MKKCFELDIKKTCFTVPIIFLELKLLQGDHIYYKRCLGNCVSVCLLTSFNTCHTGATAFTKSYFGVGFRHQFMRVTSCSGTESSLLFCTHTQLGSDPSCNATNEVGIRCIGMLATSLLI